MNHVSIEEILCEENIQLAIHSFRGKSKQPGNDGVPLSQVGEYWKMNGARIVEAITSMQYEPGIARQYEQLNRKGKRRKITVLNAIDRVLAKAIVQVLAPAIDCVFSECCYAYRKNKGTKDVALFSAKQIELGNKWVAQIDISNFFDSIDHSILKQKIDSIIMDEVIRKLIYSFVECPFENDEGQFRMVKGLIQGLSLSPLLSNVFLAGLDETWSTIYPGYCRYGDDIRVYVESQDTADKVLEKIKSNIAELKLECNKKKSGVFLAVSKSCLGFELLAKDNHVYAVPISRDKKDSYHQWQKSALKEVDHNYHIVSDGVLTKKILRYYLKMRKQKSTYRLMQLTL